MFKLLENGRKPYSQPFCFIQNRGWRNRNTVCQHWFFLIQRLKIHENHLIHSFSIHLSTNSSKLTENDRKLVGHFALCKLGVEKIIYNLPTLFLNSVAQNTWESPHLQHLHLLKRNIYLFSWKIAETGLPICLCKLGSEKVKYSLPTLIF